MWKLLKSAGSVLIAAATCYTLQDVRNEGCKSYCLQQGYSAGRAVGKKLDKCECFDIRDYVEVKGEPLSLGIPGAPLGQSAEEPPPRRSYNFYRTED